jgi:LAGLIDADG DNA endonuclease family
LINQRVIFCTDNCSLDELTLLMDVLLTKFNIKTYKKLIRKDQYRIVVPHNELDKLRMLIQAHVHTTFLYKLGL